MPPPNRTFVSVLTPTYNRRAFIGAAIKCFKAQEYPQELMEWIILDDGTDKVGDLFAGIPNVRYIALEDGVKLPIGAKRNILKKEAKGELHAWWDDDDYYPPQRITKVVYALRSVPHRSVPVAGSSALLFYYTDRDEVWMFRQAGVHHCTNATMACWSSYSKTHFYDDSAEMAEERKFMGDWTTPVLQIPPEDSMVCIAHSANTVDKRKLLGPPVNPFMIKTHYKLRDIVKDAELREFYRSLAAGYATPNIVEQGSDKGVTVADQAV